MEQTQRYIASVPFNLATRFADVVGTLQVRIELLLMYTVLEI